jgi:signal transduction histidine kinase
MPMLPKLPMIEHPKSLAVWLAVGFGAFVLAGSLALMGMFVKVSRAEEMSKLEVLGRANALFLNQSTLPQSKHMAAQLGRVMGADVRFIEAADRSTERLADGRARRAGQEKMEVGFELASGREVWFSREPGGLGTTPVWKRLDAQVALGGFWVLSLAFSLWLGRMITRPMSRLAAAIPRVGGEANLTNLPDRGPREVVQLAGLLRETHATLREEREKRRLAERLALLGRMTSSLAHEVRNPVAAIRLHAQLLERRTSGEDGVAVREIIAEAGRVDSLVRQWLYFAKPTTVAMSSFDWTGLLDEVAASLESQARHAGVEIVVERGSFRNEAVGDRERMRQAIANLLQNAIQQMPDGGVATLRVTARGVDVDDEGRGFTAEALGRFGEPFFSEREGGMGLGLAVALEIVRAHGGRLKVENLARGGARVSIEFSSPNRPEIPWQPS